MINEKDYKRLQEISREINLIMLENHLHEISIVTKDMPYFDSTNEITIHTREYLINSKQNFCFGTYCCFSENEVRNKSMYKWEYNDFITK
jgi:hypothetical protein